MTPGTCIIPECVEEVYCRGWCQLHYERWYRHGDPLKTLRRKVECVCQRVDCGAIFLALPSKVKEGKAKYCSKDCYRIARRTLTRICSVNDDNCNYGKSGKLTQGMCQRHYKRWLRHGITDPFHTKICEGCGKEFTCERSHRVTCSEECYQAIRVNVRDGIQSTCDGCGAEIVTSNRSARFCSATCAAWRRYHPDGRLRPRAGSCDQCGADFVPTQARQKYCSVVCNQRAASMRRSYRKRAVYVEDVDRYALGCRDEWVCGICHESIDPELVFPDVMSWSLDHITPISLGGEHSYANAQSAHWICNVRKGNRIAEPLLTGSV